MSAPMTPDRWKRLSELFERALEAGDDRLRFIERECVGDPDLAEQLRSLLDIQPRAERFLLEPNDALSPLLATPDQENGFEDGLIGARLAGYRILKQIGEGGMGVVYLAEQLRPRRTVALKVIRAGLATPGALKRFEHEAHILGRLQHPGIAQIYEAGATEDASDIPGVRGFFAMEYVRGRTLTEFANANTLSTRDKLDLTARIADAVQHAHTKGVIHRDLKPSNILVDDRGQPKILDFGVARATDSDIQLTTVRTSVGQLIGTLPYMSPEQVVGDPGDIDTRSDVYALGVILFELLTGRLPYDLKSRSIPEAARIIRDEEPARLSAIDKTLRGDIETIVLKSLEKNKGQRYQSAAGFAEDIRRYLAGEPIDARRDSSMYVLKKQLRRYRGAGVVAGVIVLALIGFAAYAARQSSANERLARRESLAKGEAIAARERAEAERARADLSATRLAEELRISTIEQGRLAARTGNIGVAEDLIWREHLKNPASAYTRWALWELYSHEPMLFSIVAHPNNGVRAVRLTSDGLVAASGGEDGAVRLWNLAAQARIGALGADRTAPIWSLRFSPDDRLLAVGDADGGLTLWDVAERSLVASLQGHIGPVTSVAFSADGKTLLSAGHDGSIRLWDLESREPRIVINDDPEQVNAAAFTPDERAAVSTYMDGSIRVHDLATGASIARLEGGHAGSVGPIAFSPDGKLLASGGVDREVVLWNFERRTVLRKLVAPNGTIRSINFAPDGRTLVTGGWWWLIRWDVDSGRYLNGFALPGGNGAADISPDGRIALATFANGEIRAWDLQPRAFVPIEGLTGRAAATFSRDGAWLATADGAGRLQLIDASTGRVVRAWQGHTDRVRSIRFNAEGTLLATGSTDGRLRLWNVSTGEMIADWERHNDITSASIDFSRDGRTLANTIRWNTVLFRSIPGGETIRELAVAGDVEALSVRYSPDGETIATTARDSTVRLWSRDFAETSRLATDDSPWTTSFTPDGSMIAAGLWTKAIVAWKPGQEDMHVRLKGHNALVSDVAFHPADPSILASSSADGTVSLWDVQSTRRLLTLEGFGGWEAITVDFSPDGGLVASGGANGVVGVWDLSYFDRHIAGNARRMIQRLGPELGPDLQEKAILDWADAVLDSPWPRLRTWGSAGN